jgi:hypothetical protein
MGGFQPATLQPPVNLETLWPNRGVSEVTAA